MKDKQTQPSSTEIQLFDDTLLYKRGDYWHMRVWLAKEGKYARFSLRTMKESVARERADDRRTEIKAMQLAGKKYFSLTAKQGVELYLKQRMKDVEAELIVIGRYKTIKTHLEHWLNFIDRDTKLKDLQISDCENYFHERRKSRKTEALKVSQTTIMNEQSTINAMMGWLYRQKETYIESFIFQKFKKIDKGDPSNRRPTFTDQEIEKIIKVLALYIHEPAQDKNDKNNLTKAIAGNYLGFSIMSGMRRGEMLQLRWSDIGFDRIQK